ncbi:MAG: tRNA (N(6)-L-threonylcarbamoyladenosine(37)-C(2))-methylthiotransferase MtaB [Deltaproteobacteria bacterium]|nr:tRNA (N(6)-L-threonylcarbamoyladenosine(37)-C(2))-methylthiotransferase MtaB [Deltaproteobacteria bacterium]
MRIGVYTLGCKVNQFETDAIAELLLGRGAQVVGFHEEADAYLINTCAVTAKAAFQSRQALRRALKHSNARVIATGCFVQADPQAILDISDEVCMVGNAFKERIADYVWSAPRCLGMYLCDMSSVKRISSLCVSRPLERTRAFLRVQDGCNAFCAYCIVPFTRGPSRSLEPELVMEQVKTVQSAGIREVVITGIHVGMYGHDLSPGLNIFSLCRMLCHAFPAMRFRLSSLEPTELSEEFLHWAASTSNFCPHWHIPLQSGSTPVLKAMNRHYTAEYYANLIHRIYAVMPDAAIGADVMVGFPTETEADFEAAFRLLSGLPISYLHVFPFSKRPGTLAETMKDRVRPEEKALRARVLRELGMQKRLEFWQKQIGKPAVCLVERRDEDTGCWEGHTENYLPVVLQGSELLDIRNQFVGIILKEIRNDMIWAAINEE